MRSSIKRVFSTIVLCSLFLSLFISVKVSVNAGEEPLSVDVMFTSDMHSHLNSFTTIMKGEQKNVGGVARINKLIKDQLKKNSDTLLVDGGDFSMGTLVQTLFATEAPELRMLGYMGYDFVTLGNHEFDYGSVALSKMFLRAKESGDNMPGLVVCNIDWSGELSDNQILLKNTFEEYGIKDYAMIEKNGVKIAVIGVFGKDSLASAPTCELKFSDPVEAVKNTVAKIKTNENADMIVLLSHSGLGGKAGKSEDEVMAKSVPELDLIIAGHSHTTVKEQIQIGDTHIVACGEYGEWLGSLTMNQRPDGRWDMPYYELIAIDENVTSDADTLSRTDEINALVEKQYLEPLGYDLNKVIAVNDITFSTVQDLYSVHTDHNLGNFIADAYAYAARSVGVDVDGSVSPSGTIRETIPVGEITMEEVFNMYPLGIGADGVVGFPLVEVYLYGSEIKTLAEVDASVSDFMTNARLYCSGVDISYNPNRMILDKVVEVKHIKNGVESEFEDDVLYCAVTDMYSGQMIGAVNDKSFGILSIVPKDKDGNPLTDYNTQIIHDKNGNEIKAWQAIAMYMESFDKNGDGIAVIPDTYINGANDRKVVIDSKNPVELIKHPKTPTIIVLVVGGVAILCVALIVISVAKKIQKKRASK